MVPRQRAVTELWRTTGAGTSDGYVGFCLAATVLRVLWTDLHLLDDWRRQGPAHAAVGAQGRRRAGEGVERVHPPRHSRKDDVAGRQRIDRKSTRLNSSHSQISYAVFCLKKKKKINKKK